MRDRINDVIDTIDGALGDWSVSGDAMRWTPEPAAPEGDAWPPLGYDRRRQVAELSIAPGRVAFRPEGGEWTDISHLVDTFVMHPWQGAVLSQVFGSTFREAAESLARACAASAGEIERLLSTVAELRPVITDESAAEDPRARALRLRQQRSTGPELTPASRQKRPRRLP